VPPSCHASCKILLVQDSLLRYLKSEARHLIAIPEFITRRDQLLSQAAASPLEFHLKAEKDFQAGNEAPEIEISPEALITLRAHTGYVGLALAGTLGLGVSGESGDLSFGLDGKTGITIEYLKAFRTDSGEPTLGAATGSMISSFVIPGDIDDLKQLQANDECTVSGEGSLKVSGSFDVSAFVNPLASVNLPLDVGAIEVRDGVLAGVSASITITGSYQIRAQRLDTGAIELSYFRKKGAVLEGGASASAGVKVSFAGTDLLAKLLGAISKSDVNEDLLTGLTEDEAKSFENAVQEGVDHSLQASLELALSTARDDQATFRYQIQPDLLTAAGTAAINRALKGDLSLLTALEDPAGVRLIDSVLEQVREKGVSLRVNLLGIVNVVRLSKLVRNCEFLTEPASGDLIIKETARSDRITAISNPPDRHEALRKAMFDSVMVTTTWLASQAIRVPDLTCQHVHFAVNRNADKQTIGRCLRWFAALDLIDKEDAAGVVNRFAGDDGPSTCLLRMELDNRACDALFFDASGNPRPESDYLEIGRRAMQALLDATGSDIDGVRRRFLEDAGTWKRAREIGPSPELRQLIPLAPSDPRRDLILSDITGDVYDIMWWAGSMREAGEELHRMRDFLAGRGPESLAKDAEFARRREKLQDLMAGVVKKSRVRFHEPWGMVCLFRASGSRQRTGKLVARQLSVERHGA
jgi:hypothetical protein